MSASRPRRGRHIALALGVLVTVVALVVVAGLLTRGGHDGPPAPAPVALQAAVIPVSGDAPMPTVSGLAAALAGPLDDEDLGAFTGRIADALTGKELWAKNPNVPMQPASVTKTLTAAAALLTLDREDRLTTRVVAADSGATAGTVVLVGGGDTTISTADPGSPTWYRGAARLTDLADQLRRSGFQPTGVQVDTSLYSGPRMAQGWDGRDILGGDIAPMEPVMVDGGRTQPTTVESRRSSTPALDAGRALAGALGLDPKRVVYANTPPAGEELATVQSAPLIQRLTEMMHSSDNVMAEAVGREVAAKLGRPMSFVGGAAAVLQVLGDNGVDTSGAQLHDNSGLSVDDRLTATTLDEVVAQATGDEHPQLRPLLDMLAIAGGSGTLSDRFLGDDIRESAGWLRAKTGSLTGTNTLAGVVTDRAGRVLTFSFMSNNAGPTGRNALDTLAAVLRTCGCGS
ncbi:D-alanyl-D-alanine carboxypeptidase/D-alanyl-D-alanine endopeptidase [Mycolicibacterium brumae]|uniref:D-alanyl-D-alanine carboxypeptidase/D-alanyl-D-alanine-endopeptidase n=1 Tax=Mycolicibacterium brumae TaxID=85968 RepID=A0A2G5P6T9_9MYCO|nr:D-alanyl-D-alanine carboxypeptidase/D-alanyl-D-alanine-endopeptidase [Mycolicibacterium brumae]MCV7193775.1 D-alanyl-D-alanine carboxypeptidase/D-alanyl-D-alanine-endopeptidase [Mycolicibacterium brumae]PIB74015.1 D-alanyl-D-alanine carboxypeptidase/D-alanyl-D-alanine-endopeptidase [Mycolicibacterium brumae]RWA21463.1 hypothetical protein MBRU_14720 [Mycolicibacterium brumae DSM 44177]UWW07326.1 D-alanyl-D-alanine carboxypeptidase/D-alanyl-D-alanine-endopeptidase [Mycolicibacterium brumae]